MPRVKIGLQIEETSPLVRHLIGSGKGVSEWDGIDPDEIVKVTYTVESSDIQEINPGIYYNIPSITTAKQGDTLFSDDGRLFVYDEAGSRWFLWYTFDNTTAKIHTNNTLKGEGTLDNPLSVNATVVALKGDLNPLLEGVDNGDGTYTFTSVDGSTMFTIDLQGSVGVQSVNGKTGVVTLDADDLDDTSTTNKFVTAAEKSDIASAIQPGDLATVATTGAYSDLTGTPTIPNSLDDLSGDSDDISEGTTNLFMTPLERSKLTGIAPGAEVNVNADWNAVSGDAQILNKPTLGTAAAADTGDFATAAQGSLANTALQPGDNISELVNDEGFVDAAGAAAAAPVQSVNGNTGAVTLNAGDVGAIPASEKGANNGVATLDANGQLQTSQVPSYAITEIIEASETSIAAFAANSGSYDFDIGDVILIENGGVISHYFYKGGTKTDVNEYSAISASQVDWGNVTNKPTFLYPGDNISELVNDEGFVDSAGAASAAPVQSVNGNTGAVTLDADDISDSSTTNKFVTQAEKNDIASAVQPGDLAAVATSGSYNDLSDTPSIPNSLDDLSGDSDDISEGSTNLFMTTAERSKLSGIASGAEVNVNADWNAVSGDAQILNKPTLGTAAAADTGDFATAAQGALADTAVQPSDLATVATTGAYSDLTGTPTIPNSLDDLSGDSDDISEGTTNLFMTSLERSKLTGIESGAEVNVNADWNAVSGDAQILNKPTLGTAAAADTGDFATAAQGALADTAVQPGDLATVATTGAYSDLSGTPTLGTAAAADTGDFATAAQGSLADTAVQPNDLATVATSGQSTDLTDSADLIRNDTDTYVSTDKVTQIVTLTQAEFDAIVTPTAGTLYYIIE